MPTFAAHISPHADLVLGLFRQRLFEYLSLFDRVTDQNLPRHLAAQIVAREKCRQRLSLSGIVGNLGVKGAVADVMPATEEKHLYTGDAVLGHAGDNIQVSLLAGDVLPLLNLAQRGDAVANLPRALELEPLRGFFHLSHELVDDDAALPFQEHLGVPYVLRVRFLVDVAHARRRAALNLILQTRPRAIAKIAVIALPYRENFL